MISNLFFKKSISVVWVSGPTPRYPKGLPSGRAKRLALEWGYPLGRRQTFILEWGQAVRGKGLTTSTYNPPLEADKQINKAPSPPAVYPAPCSGLRTCACACACEALPEGSQLRNAHQERVGMGDKNLISGVESIELNKTELPLPGADQESVSII